MINQLQSSFKYFIGSVFSVSARKYPYQKGIRETSNYKSLHKYSLFMLVHNFTYHDEV